ncbi:MAG TPA: ABC transporter permease [Ktedonobacterales bacterium]|nr:ABC transporter permease [Ktedonobacterales bacterium]
MMAQATHAPHQRSSKGTSSLPSMVTLACWRLRQTWRLLLIIGVGFIAAVVMLCSVPLLSQVALTAGLRDLLTASLDDSQIALTSTPNLLSTQSIANDQQRLDAAMRAQLGSYLTRETFFHLETNAGITAPPSGAGAKLTLTGADFPQAAPHIHVLQGRVPSPSSAQLEIVITNTTADDLHVQVGSILDVAWQNLVTISSNSGNLGPVFIATAPAQVVGIMSPNGDEFWHGRTFQPDQYGFKAIMSNASFLNVMTQTAIAHGGTDITSTSLGFNGSVASLTWYFPLQVPIITISNLSSLISLLGQAQTQIARQFLEFPISNTQLNGPMFSFYGNPSSLERFQSRIVIIIIPVFILAGLALVLILFFASLMASMLIERQAPAIALLRSRGASQRQIFGAFVVQCVGLGLTALLLGPLLAVLVALLIGQLTLAAGDQNALNLITANPLQAALSVSWLALVAVVVVVTTLLLSIWGAARRDVLAIRRESARTTRRPLWQLAQLDLVAAVLALAAFGISLYISRSGVVDASSNQTLALPLSLLGPMFLLVAGALVFLRLFQRLLHLLARRAARRPGAPPMLALAQMSRAPQPALRVILLFALAAAFAVFSLTFAASEQQQIITVAAQQAGADFSGELPTYTNVTPTLAQWEQSYQQISGVLAASAGYAAETVTAGGETAIPLDLEGVNLRTFAQAAAWSDQDASQPLAALLAQIEHAEAAQGTNQAVPAIVDAVAWNALGLSPGARFNIAVQGLPAGVPMLAVAEVQHIPGVNDSLETSGTHNYTTPGGIIVDYNAFASLTRSLLHDSSAVAPNYIWLRTSDDPAALAHVRQALGGGTLGLVTLNDRRALIALMQRDPFYVVMNGILLLGVVTTLLLALVAALVAAWLNARSRLTNFAVLRALGGAPRQIASVFAWEQGIIFGVSAVLGVVFGALLTWTAVPALVFTNPIAPGNIISNAEFYVIQHVLPVQVVMPGTLALATVAFLAISALALALMTRLVSRPSISQTLRLNED